MNAQIIMNCPNCNAPVEPEDDLEVGEAVECDQCEALLIVTSVEPLEVELDEDDEEEDEIEDEDEINESDEDEELDDSDDWEDDDGDDE